MISMTDKKSKKEQDPDKPKKKVGHPNPDFGTKYKREYTIDERVRGGIRSGQVKKERKAFAETLSYLLQLPLEDKQLVEVEALKSFQLKGMNIDVQTAMLAVQLQKAIKGDNESFRLMRDTVGEAPVLKQEVTSNTPTIVFDMDTSFVNPSADKNSDGKKLTSSVTKATKQSKPKKPRQTSKKSEEKPPVDEEIQRTPSDN